MTRPIGLILAFAKARAQLKDRFPEEPAAPSVVPPVAPETTSLTPTPTPEPKRKPRKGPRKATGCGEADPRSPTPENALRDPGADGMAATAIPDAQPPAPSTAVGVVLTAQQELAKTNAIVWYKAKKAPQTHYIAGYAGTGKSTILPTIIAGIGVNPERVRYAAYTGKAARVMRDKGCAGASTIHRLLYAVEQEWINKKLVLRFVYAGDKLKETTDLIVLDECSMINDALARDLLRTGIKILVFGDPGQLPPVDGTGFFTSQEPASMLSEVHRQALDSPIIGASMDIREGREADIVKRADGDQLAFVDAVSPAELLAASQVLVGKHETRRRINAAMKLHAGHPEMLPEHGGARIVVTRNNHDLGLYNGVVYTTVGDTKRPDPEACMAEWEDLAKTNDTIGKRYARLLKSIKTYGAAPFSRWIETSLVEEDGDTPIPVKLYTGEFELDHLGLKEHPYHVARFDEQLISTIGLVRGTWGYAITCHKSQGSQYPHVMIIDDRWGIHDQLNRKRWLYTAVTRAQKKVTIVRGRLKS